MYEIDHDDPFGDKRNQRIIDLGIWKEIKHHRAGTDLFLNDRFHLSINHWYPNYWFVIHSSKAIPFREVFDNVEPQIQEKLLYHLDLLNSNPRKK